jgi:hypothetical protein
LTGNASASPSGAVNVPFCGDGDYREATSGCQGKNTRSCGAVKDDTIILLFSELQRWMAHGALVGASDSSALCQRIRSDTNGVLFFLYGDLD